MPRSAPASAEATARLAEAPSARRRPAGRARGAPGQGRSDAPAGKGWRLEDLPWTEAQAVLEPDTIVVIPLGGGSVEHGPHLKLRNDRTIAEYLSDQVLSRVPVVVAPTLTYHYYPAFADYPGSTSLSLETARDLTADVVRGLARFGPRRFYVLNPGIPSNAPLEAAATAVAADGILLRYTVPDSLLQAASRSVAQQDDGIHADEIETSMMLHIDPLSVDLTKAVRDLEPRTNPFVLTRDRARPGIYSPSGVWGDPTLATRRKGRVLIEALLKGILGDIDGLRAATLPSPSRNAPVTARPRPLMGGGTTRELPDRCSPGDERTIRAIGNAYTALWANADAEHLGALWARGGDMAHPDGYVERGPLVIQQNRAALFARREYRNTRHPMTIAAVRCIANDIAVADGKWELRGVTSPTGDALPRITGLVTLVVKRTEGNWLIEAYRYTVDTPSGPVPPTVLKRPGYPGRGGS